MYTYSDIKSWRGLRSAEPRRRSAETRSGLAPERSLTASVSASAPRSVFAELDNSCHIHTYTLHIRIDCACSTSGTKMAAYLPLKPTSPQTQLQLLNRCVSPSQSCASRAGRRLLHTTTTTAPGISGARAITGLGSSQEVDHSAAMSQYLRMLLNLYQKCGFSSASASASPSPPLGSPKHEGSRSSISNRSPAAIRRLFSSSSREESTDTVNTQRTRTRRKELDFSKLSQLIPDESAMGTQSLWYVVTTAALLAFHHEPGVGELWAYISCLAQTEEQQIAIARRIRESCLKASVLVGFPRVCTCIQSWDVLL